MHAIAQHMAAAGLPQYTAALEANGYDSWSHLVALPRAALVEVAEELGMPKGHARRFVDSVMGVNTPAPPIVATTADTPPPPPPPHDAAPATPPPGAIPRLPSSHGSS